MTAVSFEQSFFDGLLLCFFKKYVNERNEDEDENDDDAAEWRFEDDFERNAFDFILDDEQY